MCQKILLRIILQRTGQNIKGIKATNYILILTKFINTLKKELKID